MAIQNWSAWPSQDERQDRAGDDQPVADPLTEAIDLPVALVVLVRLAGVRGRGHDVARDVRDDEATMVTIIGVTQDTSSIGWPSTCGTTTAR